MPGSTLVLVLTDVAGSTRLWAEHPAVMLGVMARHHRIVHDAVDAHGGRRPVDQGEGDAVFAAFTSAAAAVEAVLDFQRGLEEEPWPDGIVLRARVGIHAGEVLEQDGNLFGATVSATARIRALASGGQVLLSGPVLELLGDGVPEGARITELGTYRLRDLDRPETLAQIVGPGMVPSFPPPSGGAVREVVLPAPRSSFVGREQEVAELSEAVRTSRLVTITGFGGMGKTRLAIEVAAAAARSDEGLGVRFVDLSALDRAASIGPVLAEALGMDEGVDPLASVLRWLRGRRLLLLLDNLEQLLPAAADVAGRLLDGAPDLRLIVTSREPLRLTGERIHTLDPLASPSIPSDGPRVWTAGEAGALMRFPAVRLFLDRASDVRRDLALSPSTARAIATICARLDGSPLAIELVAVRLRVQSPQALLPRLEHALDIAADGIRDLPARQRTLRATIDWSVRALGPDERRLLWRLSVFPGTFTADAAQQICSTEPGSDVLPGLIELVDHSLVRAHPAAGLGEVDRFDLLVPIREYAAERLAEADPEGTTLDRHAARFAEAVRLGPGATRDDRSALATVVDEEWHNIRAAFDRLHDRGSAAEEIAGSPLLGRCLQLLGREGSAISLLRHAADHLDPEDCSDPALSVLIHLTEFEFGADRGASALPALHRAYRLLGRNGSPVQTAHLAIVDALMQDPCGAGPALFEQAYDLIDGLADDVAPLPKWVLTDLWAAAAIIVGDRRAEPLVRQLLDASSGREHLHLRAALGADLSWAGRSVEAEELLSVFTDATVRAAAYPIDRILPLMVLADIRIGAGRAAEAGAVLEAAEAGLAAFDQPFEHAMTRVQRAAIDRATGDLDDAAERLESLLASPDAAEVEGASGFARWLLAVVERERDRPRSARQQLRLAWEAASAWPDAELVGGCLLERSVQSLADEPIRALQDFAAATAHPAHVWVHFDVEYDTVAMRRHLEASLGQEAVESALAAAAGARQGALPEWDGP